MQQVHGSNLSSFCFSQDCLLEPFWVYNEIEGKAQKGSAVLRGAQPPPTPVLVPHQGTFVAISRPDPAVSARVTLVYVLRTCARRCGSRRVVFTALNTLRALPAPPTLLSAPGHRSGCHRLHCSAVSECQRGTRPWPFQIGFLHLALSFHGSLAHFPLALTTFHCLEASRCIYPSPPEGHFGCFQVRAAPNETDLNICVQVFLWV